MAPTVKSTEQNFLQSAGNFSQLSIVPIEEQKTGIVKYGSASRPLNIDAFTASFTGSDSIPLYNAMDNSNTGSRSFTTSALAYALQSTFFKDDAMSGHDYITHP